MKIYQIFPRLGSSLGCFVWLAERMHSWKQAIQIKIPCVQLSQRAIEVPKKKLHFGVGDQERKWSLPSSNHLNQLKSPNQPLQDASLVSGPEDEYWSWIDALGQCVSHWEKHRVLTILKFQDQPFIQF